MKKIDMKSFLIGVLITTNLFLIMGFTSKIKPSQYGSSLYDIDDVYTKVRNIESILEDETSAYGYNTIKSYLRKIYSEIEY